MSLVSLFIVHNVPKQSPLDSLVTILPIHRRPPLLPRKTHTRQIDVRIVICSSHDMHTVNGSFYPITVVAETDLCPGLFKKIRKEPGDVFCM